MREFKFRAWDKKLKQMRTSDDGFDYDRDDVDEIYGDSFGRLCQALDSMDYENTVLMQYTGLKDKNGKEIYEGDYLLAKDWGQKERYRGSVVWQVTEFVVMSHKLTNKTWARLTSLAKPENLEEWEIIGNIYESPNLLNKPSE